MAVSSTGVITGPVSINDVKASLNASTSSIKELCSHNNINMWAKYKPISHNSSGKLTEDERFSAGYGITGEYYDVFSTSGRNSLLNNAKQGKFGWTYEKPSGNDKCRIRDFEGYDPNSVFPFICSCSNNQTTGFIDISQRSGLSSGNITVSDLTSMVGQANSSSFTAGGYGIVYKKSGDTNASYTEDAFDGSGNTKFPISGPQTVTFTKSAGTYEACVYITKNGNASQVFAIPGSYFTITVKSSGGGSTDIVSINGLSVSTGSKIKFSFSIKNNTSDTLPSGTARVDIYTSKNQTNSADHIEVEISSLGAGKSDTFESDGYEGSVDISTASHWTVTYQGVTSAKQEF